MKDIKVSIVIPIYNAEKTIEKCLDSLISQTYSNIEIICVNDYSKDGVLSILERYEKNDPRIVLINHTENKNAGGARNTGIRAAQGEYICFVDQDDWLRQDAIEILVKNSKEGTIDFITSDSIYYYGEDKWKRVPNLLHTSDIVKNIEWIFLDRCRILGGLFKKSLFFENNLFFPEKLFYEDIVMQVALPLCCHSMISVDDTLYYYYCTNDTSTTHTTTWQKVMDIIKVQDDFVRIIKNLGKYTMYQELLNYRVIISTKILLFDKISQLPYVESKKLASKYIKEIPSLLPNRYVSELPLRKYLRLRFPRPFFLLRRCKICLYKILGK